MKNFRSLLQPLKPYTKKLRVLNFSEPIKSYFYKIYIYNICSLTDEIIVFLQDNSPSNTHENDDFINLTIHPLCFNILFSIPSTKFRECFEPRPGYYIFLYSYIKHNDVPRLFSPYRQGKRSARLFVTTRIPRAQSPAKFCPRALSLLSSNTRSIMYIYSREKEAVFIGPEMIPLSRCPK